MELSHLHSVTALTHELLKHEQVEIPVTNYLCNGIYARQIDVPKDTFITGKIHKHANLAQLVSGEMKIISGTEQVGTIKAPLLWNSPAGIARAALTVTDCTFITYHNIGELTDIQEIEKFIGCDSVEEYEQFLLEQDKTLELPL